MHEILPLDKLDLESNNWHSKVRNLTAMATDKHTGSNQLAFPDFSLCRSHFANINNAIGETLWTL